MVKRTGRQNDATAKALAEAVGCLPLALEQASAYIETSGCTITHYLNLFEKHQSKLLQRGEPSTEYPDTVATTWSISFQNVERDNPPAAELLRLCAFFAPDDIPVKMITKGAQELPESLVAAATDPLLLDDALIALRNYSLVEVENEKLSIHRLVQAVIRHLMNAEEFKQWTGVAAHVVNASYPTNSYDVRAWPLCAPLLPHASVALSHADEIQFTSNETAVLLNGVGLYMKGRAEYVQAKRMHERALAISEVILGANHPDVAVYINNLGEVLQLQGEFANAKALFEHALAIDEAVYGPDHPNVAVDLNNIGEALREQGDLEGAKPLFERAIAIDEAVLGPNHPIVAIRLNNLGNVLASQGNPEGAKPLFERALAIDEAALGPDHPDVATLANNLGVVLNSQGDFVGAKALFERSIDISKAALGPNHPDVAIGLNHLADVQMAQGDVDDAMDLYECSLQILREILGDNHPFTKLVQQRLRLAEEEMKNRSNDSAP